MSEITPADLIKQVQEIVKNSPHKYTHAYQGCSEGNNQLSMMQWLWSKLVNEASGMTITERGSRGFQQYGEPFMTKYGHELEVYESSSADGPHVWLSVSDSLVVEDGKDGKRCIHLNMNQAIELRNRLDLFIGDIPDRWAQHE